MTNRRRLLDSAVPTLFLPILGPSTSKYTSPAPSEIKRAAKRKKSSARSPETDTDSSDGSEAKDESDEHLRDDDNSRESSNQTSLVKETDKGSDYLHESCYCNGCSNVISGFRYICVHCTDFDLCISCEMTGLHGQHYVLRVPGQRPSEEIAGILEKIRESLFKPESIVGSIKTEIIEEQDPLEEVEKIYIDVPVTLDNQRIKVENQEVTYSQTATGDAASDRPPNKKSRMELKEVSNFKDLKVSSHLCAQPKSAAPNFENLADILSDIKIIKVENDFSEEARCEVFMHKDADSSSYGLVRKVSDLSDLGTGQRAIITPVRELVMSNFTATLGVSNVMVTEAPPVSSTGQFEPATMAPQTSQCGAVPEAQLSRLAVIPGRYVLEVSGIDTSRKGDKLPEDE